MSSVGYFEKKIFEDVFDMKGGYVLNFTNNSFDEFFKSTVGIDIYDEKYSIKGESKANRLRTFIDTESNELVGKIVENLIKIIEVDSIEVDEKKLDEARKIALKLKNNASTGVAFTNSSLDGIWEQGKIRVFISHRDKHKKDVAELATKLERLGISGFVAHDTINPTTKWKDEIHKGLQTMDACLAYITQDFYKSVWTNQEIGFALARGVPVFLYSIDGTDPSGFHFDIQAIKKGEAKLFSLLKETFKSHPSLKNSLIDNFCEAKEGSFDGAKSALIRIVGLELNDSEIEKIALAFDAPAKHINQLRIILSDEQISQKIKKEFNFKEDKYVELLENRIFSQHSEKRFKVTFDDNNIGKIYDEHIPF